MKKNDKATAVYVRVSSAKQDSKSQVPDLVKWCRANLDVKLDVAHLQMRREEQDGGSEQHQADQTQDHSREHMHGLLRGCAGGSSHRVYRVPLC